MESRLTLVDLTSKHTTDYIILDSLGEINTNCPGKGELLTVTRGNEFRLLNTRQESQNVISLAYLPGRFLNTSWISVGRN